MREYYINMNKRDTLFEFIHNPHPTNYVPAAFFMHFDAAHHTGQGAIDKHLEFFRYTGMDFVKIQYEQIQPSSFRARRAKDWLDAPRYRDDYFEPTVELVQGLVQAAKKDALVVLTIYSPFMWAKQLLDGATLAEHFQENPDAVAHGLQVMTDNVARLVRNCKQVGIDGFYISTQGGEANRFSQSDIFEKYIKPTDLAIWDQARDCTFNILHVCDYDMPYDNLTPFLDYPGHIVNSSLYVGNHTMTPKQASEFFGRPFMGGIERKGTIATGSAQEIQSQVKTLLANAPERFMLGADCTIPSDAPWENLKTAIDAAHEFRK